jgi:hypothetical protein
MIQAPALHRSGTWSFKIATGTAAELASWLVEQHGYTHRTVKNSMLECERCERGPAHNRAIVIAFKSGAVIVQGSATPRYETVQILAGLVADDAPEGEQLDLFGGTVEEYDGGHWIAFGGAE